MVGVRSGVFFASFWGCCFGEKILYVSHFTAL